MVVQGAIGDIVEDQEPLLLGNAIAHERHEVPMMYADDDVYFRPEFSVALRCAHLCFVRNQAITQEIGGR